MASDTILDAYMIITGTGTDNSQVHGEALDATYGGDEHGFAIETFEWSAERKEASGKSKVRKAFAYETLQLHDFTITKTIDTASPYLFLVCCYSDQLPSAQIVFRKTGASSKVPTKFVVMQFLKIQVKEVTWTVKDEAPEETVSFGFQEVKVSYFPQATTGVIGQPPPMMATWNIDMNSTQWDGD